MAGYPKNYTWLMTEFKSVLDAHQEYGKQLNASGPIDDKTAQLIQLAGAAASQSEGAVHSHTKRALDAGANKEEVYHSILLLASTIGFPRMAAALSWARDSVEKGLK
jgi:4-carboxymuconolactone decarboxylase